MASASRPSHKQKDIGFPKACLIGLLLLQVILECSKVEIEGHSLLHAVHVGALMEYAQLPWHISVTEPCPNGWHPHYQCAAACGFLLTSTAMKYIKPDVSGNPAVGASVQTGHASPSIFHRRQAALKAAKSKAEFWCRSTKHVSLIVSALLRVIDACHGSCYMVMALKGMSPCQCEGDKPAIISRRIRR